MSNFKYNTWGRTRQPKNVAGLPQGKEAVTFTADPSTATDGYSTENQRYLHLHFKETQSSAKVITVYGYNYAAGIWFPLYAVSALAVTITANNATVFRIFEIAGVDRVYFKTDVTLHTDDIFVGACSTF